MNAADAFDIGSFDEEDTKGIKVRLITTGSSHREWRPCPDAATSKTAFISAGFFHKSFPVSELHFSTRNNMRGEEKLITER